MNDENDEEWWRMIISSCLGVLVIQCFQISFMTVWYKNLLVRKTPQQLEIIIPHHLSFIIHPSSFFNHPSSFFINPSFILQLFNFLAYCSLFENVPQNQCYQWNVPIMTLASWDHFWVKLTCKRHVKGCLEVQDVQKNWL